MGLFLCLQHIRLLLGEYLRRDELPASVNMMGRASFKAKGWGVANENEVVGSDNNEAVQ